MEELIKKIEQWGKDRGIDKYDPLLQTTKTLEEVIELQQAIIRYEKAQKDCNRFYNDEENNICNDCNYHEFLEDDEDYFKDGCFYKDISTDNCQYITDIKDSIGDIFITFVMLNLQTNYSPKDWFIIHERARINSHLEYTEKFIIAVDILNILTSQMQPNIYGIFSNMNNTKSLYLENVKFTLHSLREIARRYDLSLEECIEHAYNEIKDRKGEIVDGL